MALSTAEAALKAVGAKAVVLIVAKPTNPEMDDVTVVVPIADTSGFFTPTSGTEPSTGFLDLLAEGSGVDLDEYLTSPGTFTGESRVRMSSIVLEHGEDAWHDYDWSGRPVNVYVGALADVAGVKMEFDDFDVFSTGLIDRMRPLGGNRWRLTFADQRLPTRQKISKELFRGFGGGFYIFTAAAHASGDRVWLEKAHDAGMDITGAMSLFWVGRFESAGDKHMIINGSLTDMNYGLMVEGTDLKFGSDAERISVTLPGSIDLNKPVAFGASVETDGKTVTLYGGNDVDDFAKLADASALSSPIAATTSPFNLGRDLDGDHLPYEASVWTKALSFAEFCLLVEGPVTDAASQADMREGWRFSEGIEIGAGPDIVFGEKSVLNLENAGTGTPLWSSSFTADDPDLLPGSLAGTSTPLAFGLCRNVLLSLIDRQRQDYTFGSPHGEASDDVIQTRQNGVPMISDSAVAAADVTFNATARTALITAPAGQTFEKMIPSQDDPPRLGQRIQFSGTTNNNKVFRLLSLSADGLTATLGDELVVGESPTGVAADPVADDVQYSLFGTLPVGHPTLSNSSLRLANNPSGELTADVIGRVSGSNTYKWSELFEILIGSAPDTAAVTFDPPLGLYVPPGSPMTVHQALDWMARSAFGWWIEEPDGSYKLGTWTLPSGSNVAEIDDDLEIEVTPGDDLDPVWRYAVGFRKNWHEQQKENLATSVSAEDRQTYLSKFTWLPFSDGTILASNPSAIEHPGFETLLTTRADAVTFRDLAKPFITSTRRFYKIKIPSFWAYFIKLNDVIRTTFKDPTLGLTTTDLRVNGRSLNTSPYSITLEAFK